jgi:acetyl-CoA acyltransferase
MTQARAFICDAIRTPFGRYGGSLAAVRTDDLAAIPIRALMARHPEVDWACVDDVYYGCANQSGEDNRNVGRMAVLLAGLPESVPGSTVNRLCGSSLDAIAIAIAARSICDGDADVMIAGGVESMTRAPSGWHGLVFAVPAGTQRANLCQPCQKASRIRGTLRVLSWRNGG